MKGAVYIIACPEPKSIKVGYTARNPLHRLAQLQTGCPSKLVMVGWYPGSRDDEKALHREMKHARITGEWFRLDETVSDALRGPITLIKINNSLTGHAP